MKNGSILIISNDKTVGNTISEKIKLLRECDEIKIVSFIESISVLNMSVPALIILYCSNKDSANIVKEIRALKSLNSVPIIFVMDSLVEDVLFYAFDNGIDDFFFLNEPDSVILMRIFLTLHKAILYKQIETNKEILVSADIIDKNTGIYTKEYTPVIMRNLFSNSLEDNLENTVFLYIKPVDIEQKRINMQKIASVIKSVPRSSDIVAHGKGSGFYLILYNSGIAGAKSVVSRIKNKLANICKIYANAAQITASFEEMEPVLYSSMNDQISAAKEFNFLNELNITNTIEVMDITDENGKKLKDFKKEFFDNFEKIVAPVFFRMQTTYNESFPESEIKFNISETQSSFYITQNNIKSELLITYPSYIKIIFDIIQTKENETPEARRTVLDFEDFSEEKITLIIQDMINDFINKLNAENIKIPE